MALWYWQATDLRFTDRRFESLAIQATYTCVPLSPSSIIWYRPREVIALGEEVTAGLVESNDSLPPVYN